MYLAPVYGSMRSSFPVGWSAGKCPQTSETTHNPIATRATYTRSRTSTMYATPLSGLAHPCVLMMHVLLLTRYRLLYSCNILSVESASVPRWKGAGRRFCLDIYRHTTCAWHRQILIFHLSTKPAASDHWQRKGMKTAIWPMCALRVNSVVVPCSGQENKLPVTSSRARMF